VSLTDLRPESDVLLGGFGRFKPRAPVGRESSEQGAFRRGEPSDHIAVLHHDVFAAGEIAARSLERSRLIDLAVAAVLVVLGDHALHDRFAFLDLLRLRELVARSAERADLVLIADGVVFHGVERVGDILFGIPVSTVGGREPLPSGT
jgi:hypothetical protein